MLADCVKWQIKVKLGEQNGHLKEQKIENVTLKMTKLSPQNEEKENRKNNRKKKTETKLSSRSMKMSMKVNMDKVTTITKGAKNVKVKVNETGTKEATKLNGNGKPNKIEKQINEQQKGKKKKGQNKGNEGNKVNGNGANAVTKKTKTFVEEMAGLSKVAIIRTMLQYANNNPSTISTLIKLTKPEAIEEDVESLIKSELKMIPKKHAERIQKKEKMIKHPKKKRMVKTARRKLEQKNAKEKKSRLSRGKLMGPSMLSFTLILAINC